MSTRWVRVLLLSAAVLFAGRLAEAKGAAVDQATDEQKERATRHFQDGMALFDEFKYGEALASFRASYEAVASPNSHLLVARSLARLERWAESYEEYTLVMEEAKRLGEDYDAALSSATEERELVRPKVSLLKLSLVDAPPKTQVRIGSRVLASSRLDKPVAVNPGELQVMARTPDGREVSQPVTAEAGGSANVELLVPPEKDDDDGDDAKPGVDTRSEGSKQRRDLSYIAGAVGVGGLLTYTVITVASIDSLDDVAVGGLLIGAVGVGAGVVLFLTSEGAPESAAAPSYQGPVVRIGLGSVSVSGRF